MRKLFISAWEINKVFEFKFDGPKKENVKISLALKAVCYACHHLVAPRLLLK